MPRKHGARRIGEVLCPEVNDPIWLDDAYRVQGKTQQQIANELNVSPGWVLHKMKQFGIQARPRKGVDGFLTGVPKSAEHRRKISESKRQWWEEHPELRPARPTYLGSVNGQTIQRNVAWHIAETKLGRKRAAGEVVHHIDGNPSNNDPDNLVILPSQADHARLHNAARTDGLFGSRKV